MADSLPTGVIISPDTKRANRLPPGQSRTLQWPVLDASGTPSVDRTTWRITVGGLVRRPVSFDWAAFTHLPRTRVYADFHCVTRWSRLGNLWEGVSTVTLAELAGGVCPEARYVLVHARDNAWTTNLAVEAFLSEDSLVATHHDGEPLSAEHGGPARLIVPRLYAWKSAKWIRMIEFMASDRRGFWESNGYHMRGDPWLEERFAL